MAAKYGFDISVPASNAKEAIQWLYFGYLGAVKDQNGAAMSLGRTSTFLDIYIERDMQNGNLTEEQAQELIDQFIIKLRLVRFLRAPEYNLSLIHICSQVNSLMVRRNYFCSLSCTVSRCYGAF